MPEQETFIAYIDKYGVIYSKGYGTQKDIEIGLDNKAIAEIKADADAIYQKAEKYLEELYSAGVRKRPLSPEQVAQEQSKINQELLGAIQDLRQEIKTIKEKGSGLNENSVKIVG